MANPSISLSNLAAQVTKFPAPFQAQADAAAQEVKEPVFCHNSMLSYSQEHDQLVMEVTGARRAVADLQGHVNALNEKLQAARELEEAACEDQSREGKADLQKARQLIESCSKKVADLEARLEGAKRFLHLKERLLATFPQAELRAEQRRAKLREKLRGSNS